MLHEPKQGLASSTDQLKRRVRALKAELRDAVNELERCEDAMDLGQKVKELKNQIQQLQDEIRDLKREVRAIPRVPYYPPYYPRPWYPIWEYSPRYEYWTISNTSGTTSGTIPMDEKTTGTYVGSTPHKFYDTSFSSGSMQLVQ